MTTQPLAATDKKACDRCGTCCLNGGPALHTGDRALMESGNLKLEHIITIRRGEAAFHPLSEQPRTVEHEFLKITGQRGSWACVFFDRHSSSCSIYEHRPLACDLLKCWEPEAALDMIGRNLLTRFDFIPESDPLLPLVRLQEEQCPCPDLNDIARQLSSADERRETLERLTEMARRDLALREKAMQIRNLSVAQELFYFGRPLFHLLAPFKVAATESPSGIVLQYRGD